MTSDEQPPDTVDGEPPLALNVRERAEQIASAHAAEVPENAGELSPLATQELLRELRVHQIELELQNEELRATEASLDVARARYADLYEHAPVGYLSLDSRGRAVDVNATAVDMLGVTRATLVGAPLSRFILPSEQDEWYFCFRRLASTGSPNVAR